MSDEIRKDGEVTGQPEEPKDLPHREDVMPKDHETYTPQGGGAGTGSGPIREVAAVGGSSTPPAAEGTDAVRLPQVGPEIATAQALGLGDGPEAGTGLVGGAVERPEASSLRLLLTLGFSGMIAGALLVFVFIWSNPRIQAYDAMVLREAVTEVLKGPDRFEEIFLLDGELVTQIPVGVDSASLERVFLGYDADGNPVGFALTHARFGFQDLVTVIFGYDPQARQVLGMKVLDHSETPGLGNKIEEMPFVGEFNGVDAPIEGVKPDRNTGASNQVDMITGVTISSRAVVRTINERIEQLGDLLAAYQIPATTASGPPVTGSGGGENR